MSDEKNVGAVQVYTGNGKGKTTAAFGLAFRSLGHQRKVCLIQFMKGSENYGEIKALKQFPTAEVILAGREGFINKDAPDVKDVELAQDGFEKAMDKLTSRDYDMVILDELNVAVDFHLIEVEQVMELLNERPENVELVITGRNASEELIEKADLVSEVKEIKHHFQKGVGAREGIEY
nr:cob(I)yrinic acid a,c-diamide adenosyltransferase [Natranaerobius thermophilus]